MDDYDKTIEELSIVAGSLKYCDDQRLRERGYKRINFMKDRPVRNGRQMPVEASDFKAKSALYLPEMAQYNWLVTLPDDITCLFFFTFFIECKNRLYQKVSKGLCQK